MYKVLVFLKRKPGMSLSAFREYYETVHRKLGEQSIPGARRYMRRYLDPFADPLTGETRELDFDVITEIWFDDRAAFEKVVAHSATGDIGARIAADEENLFDRGKNRFAAVEEVESDLEQPA
ncbi:EthD domain-containing protein [Croceicoccus mobilis]|uniref:EthD domain-containing protein n=1 Tax=Croceicoccus mobilis TaxID=1703339 RepID=A0A916Z830_9SPHN|nr:EthD domain-containing protein [Croceicoccus mobilis]GGD80544.1 hypothetical protein GCM10010990_33020 [Croceicoccus mobilis]